MNEGEEERIYLNSIISNGECRNGMSFKPNATPNG